MLIFNWNFLIKEEKKFRLANFIEKGEVYIKIDKMKKKIPIFILLKSLGISKKKIIYSLKNIEYLKNFGQTQNKSIPKSLTDLNEILIEKESNFLWLKKFYNINE